MSRKLIVITLLLAGLLLSLSGQVHAQKDRCEVTGLFLGFSSGWALGKPVDTCTVRIMQDKTGSCWITWLGKTTGMGNFLLTWSDPDYASPFLRKFILGGTIGFNMACTYEGPATPKTALINIRGNQVKIAIPIVYLCPNPFDPEQKDLIQRIDLLKIRF